MEAWPFESTKRSRFGQMGSLGSNLRTRFQIVYTTGASAIGVPGWPEFAACTASIESVRIVLMASCVCGLVISTSLHCLGAHEGDGQAPARLDGRAFGRARHGSASLAREAAARSAITQASPWRTRPAGIERSPDESLASASALSSPVTTQR